MAQHRAASRNAACKAVSRTLRNRDLSLLVNRPIRAHGDCGANLGGCARCMVEGESGILAMAPDWCKPSYLPTRRQLRWPNGALATLYSGEEPDRLRGPQHDAALCDELSAWRVSVPP